MNTMNVMTKFGFFSTATTLAFALIAGAMIFTGCQSHEEPLLINCCPAIPRADRNTQAARQLNGESLALMEAGELDQAELSLKAAIDADPRFGPARNNLGMVYYRQRRYYLAAQQFRCAAETMPTRTQPKQNLAMTMAKIAETTPDNEKTLTIEPEGMVTE